MSVVGSLYNRVRTEFSSYGFVRNYIFFPVMGFLREKKIAGFHKPYDKIEDLKGVHQGERCFIIATGPSLKLEDVEKLKKEYTFGINTIFKLFSETDWRPTYYVMTDPSLHKSLYKNADLDVNSYSERRSILNAINKDIVNGDKTILVHCCWLDHVYHYGRSRKFKYHPNLLFGVYDYYSVTQECIVYAIYMGFKEIYLLGADNDYTGSKQHFKNTEGEFHIQYERALKVQEMNNAGYAYVKMIAEEQGVKIFNATRGGKLEMFPRVNLDCVLEENIH